MSLCFLLDTTGDGVSGDLERGLERGAGCLLNLDPGQNVPSWSMQGTSTSHTYHLTTHLQRVHTVVCKAPLGKLCCMNDRRALKLH